MGDEPDPRTRITRHPERGNHDPAVVAAILDAAPICHLGVVVGEGPVVIPTTHARDGDRLILHGSALAQSLTAGVAGVPVCVTATLVDGVVLSRSVFGHAFNYRSAVIFGTLLDITDADDKLAALRLLVERVAPGRWLEARPPTPHELRLTRVATLSLAQASAKIRSGPPVDPREDRRLPTWAGVIPLRLVAGAPIADPQLTEGIDQDPSILSLLARYR